MSVSHGIKIGTIYDTVANLQVFKVVFGAQW